MDILLYDQAAARAHWLAELRLALRQEGDAEAACRLRRRIETLRPLLTQCRKLSRLTAHYYDPDFCRYDEYSL